MRCVDCGSDLELNAIADHVEHLHGRPLSALEREIGDQSAAPDRADEMRALVRWLRAVVDVFDVLDDDLTRLASRPEGQPDDQDLTVFGCVRVPAVRDGRWVLEFQRSDL